MKKYGEKEAWAYPGRDCPIFGGTPDYLRNGKSYEFQIWPIYIQRVYPNKIFLKFRRKGSVGVSRDCPIFRLPPIISGTGKATDFKFGQYIQRVHPNKSP